MEHFQDWMVRLVPDVLGFMASGWIGWLFYVAALVLMIWTLLSVWHGRWRRPVAVLLVTLVLGLLVYFAEFDVGSPELELVFLFISLFLILVTIATLLLAVPIGLLGRILSRSTADPRVETCSE